jgi:hypothetical protein
MILVALCLVWDWYVQLTPLPAVDAVRLMASPKFADRELGSSYAIEHPKECEPALRRALLSVDPEVRRRAAIALEAISTGGK